jgi:hypothetical protein
MPSPTGLDDVIRLLSATGLAFRGAFHPAPADIVPPLPDGAPVGTLVLAGLVGSEGWPAFTAAPEPKDSAPHPLDRWSRRLLDALAAELGARPLYPFGGPPYHPFQRWARRAEPVHPSPLGMLIHPDWGLWHSYRGALAVRERLALPPPDARPSPCDTCAEKPCLSTCPVGAFTRGGYDVPACVAHIASAAGRDCLDEGCRARRACPVGTEHSYGAAQAEFHMRAFLRSNEKREEG